MYSSSFPILPYDSNKIIQLISTFIDPFKHDSYIGKLPDSLNQDIFRELQLTPGSINAILVGCFSKKGICEDVHSDNWSGNIQRAINLPLFNCKGLFMNWYSVPDTSKIFIKGRDGRHKPVPMIKPEYAKLEHSVSCDKPFIADINQWHTAEKIDDEVSIMISVRFFPWSGQKFNIDEKH